MQIVTGRRGEPHVTSRQMQAVYRSFLGDFALLDVGNHLAATATSNDNVRISDGVVAVQGIYAVIAYNEYDDSYIEPVSVGMKRIDTLILHYTKSNDIEDMQIEVVEGEEAVDNPVAPTIAEGGDAWEGTADIKVPIYDVLVTSFGLTVTPYSRMNTLIPTLDSIAERIPEHIVTGVKGDSETLYRNGNVNITKDNIGLGNVDNTADTNKPVSNATQTALNLKADLTYVDAKIAAAYHAGGSKTVAELTSALLIADNMGKVYNMSDSGTTTADFVEGAGEPINEGDNVGICNVGTEESPIYKFDLLSGFVDLSAYATTSAVNAGLAGKVDKVTGKGLSTEDYTTTDKTKLAGIEAQANKTIVDSSMSTTSTNPLQNKVITAELAGTTTATGNPLTIESAESNLVECTTEVEAYQDLHGYDHPWVGGAGKNLFDAEHPAGRYDSASSTTYDSTTKTLTITGKWYVYWIIKVDRNTDYNFSCTKISTTQSNSYNIYTSDGSGVGSLITGGNLNEQPSKSFNSGSNDYIAILLYSGNNTSGTMEVQYVQVEKGTTKTSYADYTNISPITGQTEVVIDDVGKNLISEIESGMINIATGQDATSDIVSRTKGYIPTNPSTAYTFSGLVTDGNIRVFEYGKDKSFLGSSVYSSINKTVTLTVSENTYFIRAQANDTIINTTAQIQCELGNTPTEYEPYKGKTYTIQLGDTIYGGELDVLTGELRVTHGFAEFDGSSDEDWSAKADGNHLQITVSGAKFNRNAITSSYPFEMVSSWVNLMQGYAGSVNSDNDKLRIYPSTIYTLADWKTWLSNNPLQVCYELATPYTIQLTPQQIRLLKGTNNISCNTGDLSIKYYPDNVLGQLKGDIEGEYDERVETLETQVQELQPSLIFMSKERRDITSDLSRLSTAVAEQNLPKYGYKIGDYFTGASGYTYILADYNTFKGTSTPYCISTNHIGIVVDTHQTSQWHSGDASNVGYNGSVLNTFLKGTVLDTIKTDFKALFGGSTGLEHLIAHSKLYTTALANWAWQANQYISALTCTQIDAGSQWTANGFQEGEASKSLELFRKYKWTEIFGNESPWLRDLSSGSSACNADADGHLDGAAGVTRSRFVVGLINFH